MSLRLRQHYYVLGLDPNASQEDVKQKYKQLAFETHPDKNRGSEEVAKVRFQAVSDSYEKLMTHSKLILKPLPPTPGISVLQDPRTTPTPSLPSPAMIPLPDSPTLPRPMGPRTRSISRRRPVHLEASWQSDTRTGVPPKRSPLESPMPPPVPLKIRSKSGAPRSPPKSPRSPRRATTVQHKARNFSISHREPLSPTFAGVSKQRSERTIHDVRASIFATLTSLQNVASSTVKITDDDAMYGTLQRLKRRMLNGRHRKIVHTDLAAGQHWAALELGLLRIQRRCYEVDMKRRIDLRQKGRRNEIVGMLNAWEQEVRGSWTNVW